jgi:hypothetical protein
VEVGGQLQPDVWYIRYYADGKLVRRSSGTQNKEEAAAMPGTARSVAMCQPARSMSTTAWAPGGRASGYVRHRPSCLATMMMSPSMTSAGPVRQSGRPAERQNCNETGREASEHSATVRSSLTPIAHPARQSHCGRRLGDASLLATGTSLARPLSPAYAASAAIDNQIEMGES